MCGGLSNSINLRWLSVFILLLFRWSPPQKNHLGISSIWKSISAFSDFFSLPHWTCERLPKPQTFWNSYIRTLILDIYYHETLRNDRGDTKNDDIWYTSVPDFITNVKSLGTMRGTQKTTTISAAPLLMFVPWKRFVDSGDLGYGPVKCPYNKLGTAITMPSGVQRPRPSKAPELTSRKAPELTSWKDWKHSSDWSPDATWNSWTSWNSWNSKEKWIHDKRYQEQGIEREKEPWEANYEQAWSVEDKDHGVGQWTNWPQKWEDDKKTEIVKELAWLHEGEEYEDIVEDEQDDHEALIKRTEETLQRYRGEAPLHQRAGKRGRNPSMERSGKAASKPAKAGCKKLDDNKKTVTKLDVWELRYSQKSCKKSFQCGRLVSDLVQDLLDKKVSLSAPFLQLTVFEATSRRTKKPLLRCIDNRRLYALKEYAERSGKDRLMVNVDLYSNDTLKQVQRFIKNSDDTEGRSVRVRTGGKKWRWSAFFGSTVVRFFWTEMIAKRSLHIIARGCSGCPFPC